ITQKGAYVPINEMRLAATYPVIEGYKGHPAFGWHVIVEDPMQFDQLLGTISYSPSNSLHDAEQWHLNLQFHTIDWHFQYWHNYADFYDLFGPIERARKGDAWLAGYKYFFIYDVPRTLEFDVDAAYYMGLDTLPAAQNVQSTLDKRIF